MAATTRPPRRPQAERSAETRARLIEAAIVSLHRIGYGATTLATVATEAGISRGAITYQFSTKTELMLAVVATVFEQDAALYNRSAEALSPQVWMRALPSTMWDVMSRPSALAVMEIKLASRADSDLADKLRLIEQRLDTRRHVWISERHRDAGLIEDADSATIHRVFLAAVRGLSIDAVFLHDPDEIARSIAVLRRMLCLLYPELEEEER
ncbi:MAG: transcriptional regulator, TetR family [Sphingomonas bacterium]|uniref:TetR/AcrR family transcriptional regulator n=1 Tax=Sphingomonas bacterium TaxID=1895847 RepID=UPI0026238941|nr:TetR/AcrR family transcriptional regulator [Sphingomonas bacterium]MDB5711750.1 transcriptional regulator, TetR family [Sphingomonas bacterium]